MPVCASSTSVFAKGLPGTGRGVRSVRRVLIAGLLLCGLAGPTLAQLDEEDIAALRERGKREGWTFQVGLNEATHYALSDLCGTVVPPDWVEPAGDGDSMVRGDLPAAWDWRDYNGCTPVRNQGGCGSCWAFSAVGAVECSILINEGWSTNLSEQWLVSCTTAGSCSGGWPSAALAHLICGDVWRDPCGDCGPVRESDFPYVGWNAPCGCPYPHPYTIDNWGYVGGGINVERIKQAIYDYGPVSVTVAVDSAFQAYDDGVFNACWENGTVNHAVVLVGWDDNQGSDGIWIMRNSWGSWWGEGGYMRIEYGCSEIGGHACYVEYRFDCNHNGIPDAIEITEGTVPDCNANEVPDECDIARGVSTDCNENGVPDECETQRVERLYVDPSATGANTGMSWEDALTDLQTAYCYTQTDLGVTEVWVAHGTYTPANDDGNGRAASFHLASGVAFRGGFAGTETILDQRDLSNPDHRTILSGDLLGDDEPNSVNRWDNSYHVVRGDGADASAVLDGFTIMGGHADASTGDNTGGGMLNSGGSPTVMNCTFLDNYALIGGGAMSNEWGWNGIGSSPVIINCAFSGNHAGAVAGAMYNVGELLADANPTLINCTLVGNSAEVIGGLYSSGFYSVPTLVNCVLWDNSDASGDGESAQVTGNSTTVNYSCIQGLTGDLGGTGNIGAAPLLVDADGSDDLAGTLDDNVRLGPGSACIDAGDNSSVPDGVLTDLDGNPRFADDPGMPNNGNAPGGGAVVDLGAYEFQGSTCFGDLNGDNEINLADLSALLANYGTTGGATYGDGDLDGNGAVDLADLGELLSRYGESCS